mgnify:CR=1 FL=1
MNLVFISPNFPTYYWNFCKSLRERGVTVLGIGDAPYDDLVSETRESLVEYYRVNNLQNYDEVYRAMGFFIGKYGRIDYIESQNEFWLELEAKLREDFNIHHGVRPKELEVMKYKSKMKEIYKKANVPTARYKVFKNDEELYEFCKEVGFPIVVKPDNGVGATSTYKLKNKKQVSEFLTSWDRGVSFIAEEFVNGHVETFDGITDSKANILICTSHVMMQSIMDIVNEGGDTSFYGQIVEGSDIKEVGTRVVKAFEKFFHFEFFRLDKDKEGLGKKGDLVGLEVNMRAPGAYIPDMMNYSYNANVYDIFADMLIYDHCFIEPKQQYCIGYAGRRNGLKYKHHSQQIRMKYKNQLISYEIVPEALSAAMANQVYLLRAKNEQEIKRMIRYVLEKDKE